MAMLAAAARDHRPRPAARRVLPGRRRLRRPRRARCAGVEISGGSLGHGLPIAVGRALADRLDGRGAGPICLMGDGETDEGSVSEAAALAGRLGLGRLVGIIDANGHQGLESRARARPLGALRRPLRRRRLGRRRSRRPRSRGAAARPCRPPAADGRASSCPHASRAAASSSWRAASTRTTSPFARMTASGSWPRWRRGGRRREERVRRRADRAVASRRARLPRARRPRLGRLRRGRAPRARAASSTPASPSRPWSASPPASPRRARRRSPTRSRRSSPRARTTRCASTSPPAHADVTLVGVGGGVAYGYLGLTHHAHRRPRRDARAAEHDGPRPVRPRRRGAATAAALALDGPVYLRLGKNGEPDAAARGRALRDRPRTHACATAPTSRSPPPGRSSPRPSAPPICSRTTASTPASCTSATVKPLDVDAVLAARSTRTGTILTLEEHSIIGGFGSAVAEVAAEAGIGPRPARRLPRHASSTRSAAASTCSSTTASTPPAWRARAAAALTSRRCRGA